MNKQIISLPSWVLREPDVDSRLLEDMRALNVPAKQRPDERIQHMYGEKASVFCGHLFV